LRPSNSVGGRNFIGTPFKFRNGGCITPTGDYHHNRVRRLSL
jgi:hypothetical protein